LYHWINETALYSARHLSGIETVLHWKMRTEPFSFYYGYGICSEAVMNWFRKMEQKRKIPDERMRKAA